MKKIVILYGLNDTINKFDYKVRLFNYHNLLKKLVNSFKQEFSIKVVFRSRNDKYTNQQLDLIGNADHIVKINTRSTLYPFRNINFNKLIGDKLLGVLNDPLKSEYYDTCSDNSVPTFKYARINLLTDNNYVKNVNNIGLPLIIKPNDGDSSLNVYKIDSMYELEKTVKIIKKSRFCDVLMCEYIRGYVLEIATIFSPKHLTISNIGVYVNHEKSLGGKSKYTYGNCPKVKLLDLFVSKKKLSYMTKEIHGHCKKIVTELYPNYGFTRLEFMVSRDFNNFYLTDINFEPAITFSSQFNQLLKLSGMNFKNEFKKFISDL